MSMGIRLIGAKTSFDGRAFIAAVRELKGEVSTTMHDIIRWQLGLWLRDIILKIYSNPVSSPAQQRKAGERAIYGDLLGKKKHRPLFEPLKDVYETWELKPTKNMTLDAQVIKTKTGAVYLVDQVHYLPTASVEQLAKLHRENRAANGRVSVAGDRTRNIGRWKVKNTYMVEKHVLAQYVKSVQQHVGKSKASWLKAYRYFQSVVRSMLPWNPPKWVDRHEKTMWFEGVFGDQFDEIAMKGEVMGGSNVLYGKNPQEILNRTWPTRQKDLSGGYALKRLQDIFNRHQTPQARRP